MMKEVIPYAIILIASITSIALISFAQLINIILKEYDNPRPNK